MTQSLTLPENKGICFRRQGSVNPFDIDGQTASLMLSQPLNVNGRPNSDVIRPVFNGSDITGNPRGLHRIVFNLNSEAECAQYEMPFEQIKAISGSRTARPDWWKHERRSANIDQLEQLGRYIVTPRVSKHRLFVWMDSTAITTDATVVFLREDDYFFGVLHSRFHELWARGKGSQLREAESGFRYTPTTCFETFPFPKPTDEQKSAISKAAASLDELRGKWLKPVAEEGKAALSEEELKGRTLTNLYNQNPTWLVNAHKELDAAVADAYGWPVDLDDQEILGRLLALNLERAGG